MALSRDDLNQLFEGESEPVDIEERKIDAWMRTRPPTLAYNIPAHLNKVQRAELLRRYSDIGWDIEEINDQRDGNFWMFR